MAPLWEQNSSDRLIDLALRLKAWEQTQSGIGADAVEIWHQVILLSQAELQVLQPSPASLFNRDYCDWVKEQIRLLHLRQFDQLDLEHLPDELDSLVRFTQREIEINLKIICNHLLKYKYAREFLLDELCCDSWRSALLRARQKIAHEARRKS